MRQALLTLLIVSASFAAISGMELAGTIGPSGNVRLVASAEFVSFSGNSFCLNISGPIDSAIVSDRSGLQIQNELRADGNNTIICAIVPVDYLEFEMLSSGLTAKTGPLWDFDLSFGASENISSFSSTLALPAGATLKGTNGAVQSNDGSLAICWSASGIDTLHRARMRASYELSQEEAKVQDYSLPAMAGLALLLIIIAYWSRKTTASKPATGGFLAQLPSPKNQETREPAQPVRSPIESSAIFNTLDETDKEIVRELCRQGGKTSQARIYLQTHVPKATLSRRIASLANRGVILKSRKGNRNLVSIADSLQK